MKQILFLTIFITVLFSTEIINVIEKTESGFVMKPLAPRSCKAEVIQTSTGYKMVGRIVWGDPAVHAEPGDPYHGVVFVSEDKTRAWENVGKTTPDGNFILPIEPYTRYSLYAWDGNNSYLAKYDGHFYYNSELHNLYMTPTGGEAEIAKKSDIIVEKVEE